MHAVIPMDSTTVIPQTAKIARTVGLTPIRRVNKNGVRYDDASASARPPPPPPLYPLGGNKALELQGDLNASGDGTRPPVCINDPQKVQRAVRSGFKGKPRAGKGKGKGLCDVARGEPREFR